MDRLKDRWMIETLWLWYIWITLLVLLGRLFFWLGKAEFSFFDTFLPLHCYHWCRCDRGHVCMAGGFRRMRLSTGSPPSGTLSFQNMHSGRLKLLFFDMDTATLDENDNYCTIIFQLFLYVKWSSQFWVPHEWNSEHFHWSGGITSDFSRTATESCESQNVKRWHRCNMRHVGTWFGSESQPSSARFQGLACCTTENARKNSMQLACHESSAEGSAGVQLSNPRRSRPLDLWFPWLQRVLTVVLMILTAQVVQHENNPTSQSGSTVGRS